MKHKDFRDHELHFVQKWVIFIREFIQTHVFEDNEEKEQGWEVAVKYDARETPIHATTRQGIHDLLADGYKVDDARILAPENKPIPTGNTD